MGFLTHLNLLLVRLLLVSHRQIVLLSVCDDTDDCFGDLGVMLLLVMSGLAVHLDGLHVGLDDL